jgi:hypothetical protein
VTFVTFCLTPNSSFSLCSFYVFCVSYSCFTWVSSLAYPNLLGTKGKVVVVYTGYIVYTNFFAKNNGYLIYVPYFSGSQDVCRISGR